MPWRILQSMLCTACILRALTANLAADAASCCACRHRVVYRLVGGVYLMVVAAVQANVLWLLKLLDACVRVLIAVAKAVEVTPDKLARRYPEV